MLDKSNSQSVEKPNLMELTVFCVKHRNNAEKIQVKYIIDPESRKIVPNMFLPEPMNIQFFKLDDYENFLKIFDFSKLLILNFQIDGSTEVIKLFNKYNTSRNSLFSVAINDLGRTNEKNSEDVINLISNIENSNEMYLAFNFPLYQLPENFTFPVMKSLKVVNIKEIYGTQFLNGRIISHLIDNCPELRSFRISAKNKGIYYELMKILFAKQTLNESYGCKNKSFCVQFTIERELSPISVYFYRSIFNNEKYVVNSLCFPIENGKVGYSFYGFKKCSKCNDEHALNVLFEIDC